MSYTTLVANDRIVGASNPLPIGLDAPATFYHGQTLVAIAGTEVALAASQALESGVTVKAHHANAGMIFVGKNPVSSATGFVLDAGESVFVETGNLANVYIDAGTNGDGVSYIAS